MDKRCPFCHQNVPLLHFDAHVAQHTKLREDGQMTDHVTVAPEERFQGDLQGVPQWYRHEKCGAVTGMPEEIIRSYLADPFLYNDYTFCTGCGKYPHQSEFHWVDTGENLHAYNRRLRIDYIQRHNLNPNDFVWKDGAPERRKRKLGAAAWVAGCLVVLVVGVGLLSVTAVGALALFRKAARPAPPATPTPAFHTSPAFPGAALDAQRHMEETQRRMQEQQAELHRRMQQQQEEMRRQHEEMLERMRSKTY